MSTCCSFCNLCPFRSKAPLMVCTVPCILESRSVLSLLSRFRYLSRHIDDKKYKFLTNMERTLIKTRGRKWLRNWRSAQWSGWSSWTLGDLLTFLFPFPLNSSFFRHSYWWNKEGRWLHVFSYGSRLSYGFDKIYQSSMLWMLFLWERFKRVAWLWFEKLCLQISKMK